MSETPTEQPYVEEEGEDVEPLPAPEPPAEGDETEEDTED